MLVTCIQVLYLESLRIRARELPALQFFKETLEGKIGLSTERGALTFSLVKHAGLASARLPDRRDRFFVRASLGSSGSSCVISSVVTIVATFVVPQLVYRKSKGTGLIPLVPLFGLVALGGSSADLAAGIPAIAVRIGRRGTEGDAADSRGAH